MRKFLEGPIKNDIISNITFKIIKKMGWKFMEPPPGNKKYVFIGYPHTSNWDTFFAVSLSIIWDHPSFTLIKESYDKPILKSLMKSLRMLPIKRNTLGANFAQDYYNQQKVSIVLVPEGTRKKSNGWKKGFYWFAKNNNLDIVLMKFDYIKKEFTWLEIIKPGNTPDETLNLCKKIYEQANSIGKYPELASPIKWA